MSRAPKGGRGRTPPVFVAETPEDHRAWLRAWRERMGLSQSAAANVMGVSVRTWQDWESARPGRPSCWPVLFRACVFAEAGASLTWDVDEDQSQVQ